VKEAAVRQVRETLAVLWAPREQGIDGYTARKRRDRLLMVCTGLRQKIEKLSNTTILTE